MFTITVEIVAKIAGQTTFVVLSTTNTPRPWPCRG
jgi:hypothetical protein